jgi:hypothetical protein
MFTGIQCCSILDRSRLDLRLGRHGNEQLDVVGSDCLVHPPISTMLTGSELLAKVKELGDVGKSEIVRACGYVSTKKDGGERLNFTAFYEALLEAKGVELGGTSKVGKGGRKLSYVATVQGNGNLLIGKAYTAMLDLQPGDEFEIKLGRKQIRLIPVGGSDEDEE